MKKIIFISTAILFVVNFLSAQNTALIAKKATDAFSEKYPNAVVKKWKQNDSNYYVAFESDNKKSTAYYSLDGIWKKTETNVKGLRSLPLVVKKSFKKGEFRGDYIAGIKKIETASNIVYTIEVNDASVLESNRHDGMSRNLRLYFNESGDMINHIELND